MEKKFRYTEKKASGYKAKSFFNHRTHRIHRKGLNTEHIDYIEVGVISYKQLRFSV